MEYSVGVTVYFVRSLDVAYVTQSLCATVRWKLCGFASRMRWHRVVWYWLYCVCVGVWVVGRGYPRFCTSPLLISQLAITEKNRNLQKMWVCKMDFVLTTSSSVLDDFGSPAVFCFDVDSVCGAVFRSSNLSPSTECVQYIAGTSVLRSPLTVTLF